eukprot:GFKZ01006731.1.p1 GENE.GFKZ01006731.1~~GFKZ01006731.1.p1  ORF type:complete len:1270 (-),score=170.55 GFKZ01006731.1:2473-6282(-)
MVGAESLSSLPHGSHQADRETESEDVEVIPSLSTPSLRQLVRNTLSSTRRCLADSRRRKILSNLSQAISECASSHSHSFPRRSSSSNNCASFSWTAAASALDSLPKSTEVSLQPVPRLPPNGRAWIRVQTNMSLPETYAHTFHVPYLGESDRQLRSSNSLARDLLQNDLSEEEDNSDVEDNVDCSFMRDEKDEEGVNDMDVEGDDGTGVKRTIGRDRRSRRIKRRRQKHVDEVWERAAKRVALLKVMEEVGCANDEPLPETLVDILCDVFGFWNRKLVTSYRRVISSRLSAIAKVDDDIRDKQKGFEMVLKQAHGEQVDSAREVMRSESVKVFMCRQCYSFLCTLHGQFGQARPSNPPLDASTKDIDDDIATKIEADCEDKAQAQCWYVKTDNDDVSSWCREMIAQSKVWSDVEPVLRELFETFGHDACRISAMLRITFPAENESMRFSCRRIGSLIDHLFPKPDPGVSTRKRIAVQQKKRKGKWKTQRVPQEQDSEMPGRRLDYEGCHHEGLCSLKNCPCKQKGILCEKFCGCFSPFIQDGKAQSFCSNMHRGCTCKGSCQSKACLCFSMNRECDPDLCRSCHECKEGSKDSKKWSCQNNGLRMKKRQKVVAGHSAVHGWGVFATGRIAKNEIIGEYVGEVISDDEAERRGRVYDEVTYSFLFTTTEQYALDSTHIGNKLRYCNHSLNPNCEPRVMRVGGDVRVGLYAKRDIEKHEELFFNYGYNENGPAWAMEGKTSRSKAGPSGKRKLESDNDSSDICVEVQPISNGQNGVPDVELRPTGESSVPAKVLSNDSGTNHAHSANANVAFPEFITTSPNRKRPKKEQMGSNKRQNSRHQNRGKSESILEKRVELVRGQSETETKTPVAGRSLWRGFLRRVSVGAAHAESANRQSNLTNENEAESVALPSIKDELKTAIGGEERGRDDCKSGSPGEENGCGSKLREPITKDGVIEFKEAPFDSKHENDTLGLPNSHTQEISPKLTTQGTVKGVHELSSRKNEASRIENGGNRVDQDSPACMEKRKQGPMSEETDSDSEVPNSASLHSGTRGTEREGPRSGKRDYNSAKARRPSDVEMRDRDERKQSAHHVERENSAKLSELSSQVRKDATRYGQPDASARGGQRSAMIGWKCKNESRLDRVTPDEKVENLSAKDPSKSTSNTWEEKGRKQSPRKEHLQAANTFDNAVQEISCSEGNSARECYLASKSPNSRSGGGKPLSGTPSSKSRCPPVKQVERDSLTAGAAEVVDLVSVDGDDSVHTTYEPNIRDWL